NGFNETAINTKAIIVEITLYNIASERNWFISCFFSEPNTLRMPTSFALFTDCAVDKFIKFTQASTMMKNAITEKIYTYLISLSVVKRAGVCIGIACKCTSVKGIMLYSSLLHFFIKSSYSPPYCLYNVYSCTI